MNQHVTSFDQNFTWARISLIISQERIQTMVIVFNTVFKLIWYLKVNILELFDE